MNPADIEAFQQAVVLAQAGQKQEAYYRFRQLLINNPQDIKLLLWVAFTAPDLPQAERFINRATAIDRNNPSVRQADNWLRNEKVKTWPPVRPTPFSLIYQTPAPPLQPYQGQPSWRLDVVPFTQDIAINRALDETKALVIWHISSNLGAKNLKVNENCVTCKFGSQIKTRAFGGWIVAKEDFPKKAEINFYSGRSHTLVRITLFSAFGFGVTFGMNQKYHKALIETNNAICAGIAWFQVPVQF